MPEDKSLEQFLQELLDKEQERHISICEIHICSFLEIRKRSFTPRIVRAPFSYSFTNIFLICFLIASLASTGSPK